MGPRGRGPPTHWAARAESPPRARPGPACGPHRGAAGPGLRTLRVWKRAPAIKTVSRERGGEGRAVPLGRVLEGVLWGETASTLTRKRLAEWRPDQAETYKNALLEDERRTNVQRGPQATVEAEWAAARSCTGSVLQDTASDPCPLSTHTAQPRVCRADGPHGISDSAGACCPSPRDAQGPAGLGSADPPPAPAVPALSLQVCGDRAGRWRPASSKPGAASEQGLVRAGLRALPTGRGSLPVTRKSGPLIRVHGVPRQRFVI